VTPPVIDMLSVAPAPATESTSGVWQVVALGGALSVGAMAMTWRRKTRRSAATTHWMVLLSAHGGLAALVHVGLGVFHVGGALVIVAMAERVIWDVSDGAAAAIDRFMERALKPEHHEQRHGDDVSDHDYSA
jgi:hypothetical protein